MGDKRAGAGPRPLHVHIPKTAGTAIRNTLGLADPPHLTATELREHVGADAWARGFSFAIVRNPFDRLVSIYAFGRSHKRARTKARFGALPFDQWVRSELEDPENPRLYVRRTYAEWLGQKVDYVGRFEEIDAAWQTIQDRTSASPRRLPVVHRTDHAHYRDVFDAETRCLVEAHYAEDLERFGYRF